MKMSLTLSGQELWDVVRAEEASQLMVSPATAHTAQMAQSRMMQ